MKRRTIRIQVGTEQLEARDVPSSFGLAHRTEWPPRLEGHRHTPAAVHDRIHATEASVRSENGSEEHPSRFSVVHRFASQLKGAPISLDTEQGTRLLAQSTAKRNFLTLASHFTTQVTETFCSLASTAMVLNASGIPRPVSTVDSYYHYFDQENLITDRVKATIDMDDVRVRGMTLDTYRQFIGTFHVNSRVVHAADTTLADFRRTAARTLRSPHGFLIVNYQRQAIGQEAGGHFSPVAAYDARTDRFLIMDVTRYAYPPVWVPAARLWQGMLAVDSDSGQSRGFAIIEAPAG